MPVKMSKATINLVTKMFIDPANLKRPNGTYQQFRGDPLILPPGVTSAHFRRFLKRAETICGAENIHLIERADQLVDWLIRRT